MKGAAKALLYSIVALAVIYMISGVAMQLVFVSALAGGGAGRQGVAALAKKKGWNVDPRQSNPRGLEALARPDAILPIRHVDVGAVLGFDAIRAPGESVPTRDQQDVHAAIRAPVLARAECGLIESVFAAKCVVQSAEAKPRQDGTYAVSMRLLFTPKQELGRVAAPQKLAYLEVPVALGARDRRVGTSQQTGARRALYAEAAAACDKLRADNGNCGLLAMQIHTATRPGGFEVLMSGRAVLATLQRQDGS